MARFNPSDWKASVALTVREPAGLDREKEIVDTAFSIKAGAGTDLSRELRLVVEDKEESVSQFYNLKLDNGTLSGRVAFPVSVRAGAEARYKIYCGNPSALKPEYPSTLTHRKGGKGPQHRFIENPFYKIETLPKSGQIWHMWNKLGTNTSWHHNEWNENVEKGGDPCHWAPNCWAAFPERITNGYELLDGEECDFIDWHYVFGWENPDCVVIEGPIFVEVKRSGIVWPHPEHSRPEISRDGLPRISAEVTYRFYADSPLIYQASRLETLLDMNVFFIRNCQFVFLDHVFSHMIIAPDRGEVRPTDEVESAVVTLMGKINNKPYDWIEHSLSNILPGKLAFYAYFNHENHDGFACHQVADRATNIHSGKPVLQNHSNLMTEVKDWSFYTCRSYSYTNQRFNPENAVFLPKGERYEDENMIAVFRHEDLKTSQENLRESDLRIKNPLIVSLT